LQVVADLRFDVAAHIERIVDAEANDRHARDNGMGDLICLDWLQEDDEPAFVRRGRFDAAKCGPSLELDQIRFRPDDRFRHTQHVEPVAILARLVGDQNDSRVGEVRFGLRLLVTLAVLEIPRRVDERVERRRRDFELLPGLYFAEMVHLPDFSYPFELPCVSAKRVPASVR